MAQRVIHDPVPDLRSDGVPDDVQRIIEVAMAKDPTERPSARLLHEYLTAAADGRPVPFLTATPALEPMSDPSLPAPPALEDQDHEITAEHVAVDTDAEPPVGAGTGGTAGEPNGANGQPTAAEVETPRPSSTNGADPSSGEDRSGDDVDADTTDPVVAAEVIGAVAAVGMAAETTSAEETATVEETASADERGIVAESAADERGIAESAAEEPEIIVESELEGELESGPGQQAPDREVDETEWAAPIASMAAVGVAASELDGINTASFDPNLEFPAGAPTTPLAVPTPNGTEAEGRTMVYDRPGDQTAVMPPGGALQPPPPMPPAPLDFPPPSVDTGGGIGAGNGGDSASPDLFGATAGPGGGDGILSATPPPPVPLAEAGAGGGGGGERRYWFTEDDRRQFGPLLLIAAAGLLLLLMVGAFLVIRNDDGVATDDATDRLSAEDTLPAAGDAVRSSSGVAEVADVVGLDVDVARRRLEAQGFVVVEVPEKSNDTEEGTVLGQTPSGGESAEVASTIELTVAVPDGVEIPILVGLTQTDAEARLTEIGLVGQASEEFSDEIEQGRIISSDPENGSFVEPGAAVQLFVSAGPRPPTCAEVTGRSLESARSRFQRAGYSVQTSTAYSDDIGAGNVASCTIAGTTATLVVSDGREPCSEAIGTDLATGRALLEARGFDVSDSGRPATEGTEGQISGCTIEGETASVIYISAVVPSDCSNLVGQRRGDAEKALEDLGFVDVAIVEERGSQAPAGEVVGCRVENAAATLTVSLGPPEADLTVRLERLVMAPGQDCGGEGIRPDLIGSVSLRYDDKEHRPRNAIRRPNRQGVVDIGSGKTWRNLEVGRELTLSWSLEDNDGFFRENDFVGEGSTSIVLDGQDRTWQPTSGGGDACQFSWVVTVDWSGSGNGGDPDDD